MNLISDVMTFIWRITKLVTPPIKEGFIAACVILGGAGTFIVTFNNPPPNTSHSIFGLLFFSSTFSLAGAVVGFLVGIGIIHIVDVLISFSKQARKFLTKEWGTHIEERNEHRQLIRVKDSERKKEAGALSIADAPQHGALSVARDGREYV